MRDKKKDAIYNRQERELSVYVRPSVKSNVIKKCEIEGITRSKVVDEILYNHFKNNPIGEKPKFDY